MIKVCQQKDLKSVKNIEIKKYLSEYLAMLLSEYELTPKHSIEMLGAIYFIESTKELSLIHFESFQEIPFEWVEKYNNILNICVVLNNEEAINIIAFENIFSEKEIAFLNQCLI